MSNLQHYKHNRLQQLRGFCYAAQSGSISKAAERLYLSQPSVSLQIQALERELKTVLFERRGPRITLTPDGKKLYELAASLVQAMDALPEQFESVRDGIEHGKLDIAAGESTILYILPKYVKQFVATYPSVELKLHNVTGRDGLAMLRADQVDFAVGSMIDAPTDIDYFPTFQYDPVLITPLEHPLAKKKRVSMKDIAQHSLILPPRHLTTWRIVDLVFEQHGLKYNVALEAGGWEVIKKYVEMGMGISIVTSICLTGQEKLARVSLGRYFPMRTYGVVLRRGKYLSPQALRFLEIIEPSALAQIQSSAGNDVLSGAMPPAPEVGGSTSTAAGKRRAKRRAVAPLGGALI
ncbi:MAG: LysR family transcriptional regulator [Pirellulales bacterium]|nr:LysR family transcriptional regulator [Pirellulales bacterium]